MAATKDTYFKLEDAYHTLNNWLWEGKLPPVLLTFQRGKRFKGYAWQDNFVYRTNAHARLSEIALNPDYFGRTDRDICATLLHEMCHVAEFALHKPPRGSYHTKWWAAEMERVGLMPTSTGAEGGAKTGQRVTHYIINGGAFESIWSQEFAGRSLLVEWMSLPQDAAAKPKPKRVKYTCPACAANVMGRRGLRLICACERNAARDIMTEQQA